MVDYGYVLGEAKRELEEAEARLAENRRDPAARGKRDERRHLLHLAMLSARQAGVSWDQIGPPIGKTAGEANEMFSRYAEGREV
jgi:hypothetical protein